MSESKIYTIPDGNNSLDPNLMLALSQNGGFGNINGDLNMRSYNIVRNLERKVGSR